MVSFLSNALLNPRYYSDAIDIDTEKAERKYQSMIVVLEKIIKEASNRKIGVALVYIPSSFQYDSSEHNSDNPWIQTGSYIRKNWLTGQSEIQKRLEQWTSTKKLLFFDLTPILREKIKNKQPLTWKLDTHWNPAGHKVAGSAIYNWIKKEKVFSFVE